MCDPRLTPEAAFLRPQDLDEDLLRAYYVSFEIADLHPDALHHMLLAHETQPAIASQYLAEACRIGQRQLDLWADIIARRLLGPPSGDGVQAS